MEAGFSIKFSKDISRDYWSIFHMHDIYQQVHNTDG